MVIAVAVVALLVPRGGPADAARLHPDAPTEPAEHVSPRTDSAGPVNGSRSELIRIAVEGTAEARDAALEELREGGGRPGDLELVLAAIESALPDHKSRYAELLVASAEEPLTGPASAALLDLLKTPESARRKDVLRSLWGVEMGSALAERVVELAQDPASRRDALFLAVCPMPTKTEAAVDELVRATSDDDPSIRQRAWWGLGFGVPETRKSRVADHTLVRWDPASPRPAQFAWLIVLLNSAGARHLADCERLAEDERLAAPVREYARFCVRRVRQRLAE